MAKSKQFVRPPKKSKSKSAAPETADEFQEAADREEETGGKWRAGDTTKSGRAFVRALEIYDQGLRKFPSDFDLAYNKARLEFEITQQSALVEHIGMPPVDLLKQTLDSHRYALKLREDNADVLFNTAQVLISLAEQLSEGGASATAVLQLQEALELLSSCLSRQEMMMEQQQVDFDDVEGGVPLDPEEIPVSTPGSEIEDQTAVVEVPVSATDLLDTVQASLSALTTLTSLVEPGALQTFGDMAHSLTEERAPRYISALAPDEQEPARFMLGLDRAIFVAAFADAQYGAYALEFGTYLERLDSYFNIPSKDESAHALSAEARARMELVLSVLDRSDSSNVAAIDVLWRQLTIAQDLYSKATKLNTEDAKGRKATIYKSKGDLELLRHRIAVAPAVALDASIIRSAPTLVGNATTFYKAAVQLAKNDGDEELEVEAKQRWMIATDLAAAVYGIEPKPAPFEGGQGNEKGDLLAAVEECVVEGILEMTIAGDILKRIRQ